MTAADDEYLKKFDADLLWYRACQRSVGRGALKVAALDAVVALYGPKVVITDNSVTLNGLSLDAAIAEIVKKRPELWAEAADHVDEKAEELKATEALALSGSVAGHGAWFRLLEGQFGKVEGERRYNLWCKEHSAKVGQPALDAAIADAAKKADNHASPFVRLRRQDGSIDPQAALEVETLVKTQGTKAAAAAAALVGMSISGQPLRRIGVA